MDEKTSYPELVSSVVPVLLQGELNPYSAARVAESAFDFEPELEQLDKKFSVLKLYNGPTGTFKDFGIAFLAAILEELLKDKRQAMILSAVRGDSGINMNRAFQGRKGLISVTLYPSGQIRGLDPATFITNGGNIIPIQVKGTLDDCQRLIKETINDGPFTERYNITSANAINPGRLLPQAFYYLYAFIKIKKRLLGDLFFSVPSGNFGSLIAGLYAWKFGMPVNGFIAAMNENNSMGSPFQGEPLKGSPFQGAPFNPKPLIHTNSPSLDVSIPINYERLEYFNSEFPSVMRNMVYPVSIDDDLVLMTMENVYKKYNTYIDSHTAVAFAAAQKISAERKWTGNAYTVVLATGHPARTASLVEKTTGKAIKIPASLQMLQKRCDPIAIIPPQLDALEGAIASCF